MPVHRPSRPRSFAASPASGTTHALNVARRSGPLQMMADRAQWRGDPPAGGSADDGKPGLVALADDGKRALVALPDTGHEGLIHPIEVVKRRPYRVERRLCGNLVTGDPILGRRP